MVSPFKGDAPFKFKFCHCPSIIGCTCDRPSCQVIGAYNDALKIDHFSAEEIASQLTLVDSDLFLRVTPRECLGFFWSKRDKSKDSRQSKPIKVTIDHESVSKSLSITLDLGLA